MTSAPNRLRFARRNLVIAGFWAALLGLNVVLAVRLAWLTRDYESATGAMAQDWWNSTAGWLRGKYSPISERLPDQQAQFWLGEAERIVAQSPDSAEVAMGAAWMLDSPGSGFYGEFVTQDKSIAQVFPQAALGVDQDRIREEEAKFEAACHDKCLALARRATELDPDDVRWWRMRALLLFKYEFGEGESQSRSSNWQEILAESQRHDPENALYDYLAAREYWRQSAKVEWKETEDRPAIHVLDADRFALGDRHFRDAQQRPTFSAGESGWKGVGNFLKHSRTAPHDQSSVAIDRLINLKSQLVWLDLVRFQSSRAWEAIDNNRPEDANRFSQQSLRLIQQVSAADGTLRVDHSLPYHKWMIHARLLKLAREHPELFHDEASAEIADGRFRAALEYYVFVDANRRYAEFRQPTSNESEVFRAMAACILRMVSGLLLVLAAIGGGLVLLMRRRGDTKFSFGLFRHAVCWVSALAVTFTVLGLAPAEVINRDMQQTIATATICVFVGGLLGGAAIWLWWVWRRRSYRITIRAMFVLLTAFGLLFAAAPLILMVMDYLSNFAPDLWMPAQGADGLDPEVLRLAFGMAAGSWRWALLQWLFGYGPYATIALALALVALWQFIRMPHRADDGFWRFWTRRIRRRWGGLLATITASALGVALLGAAAYSACAPPLLQSIEAKYQREMGHVRQPHAFAREIERLVAEIRSEPDTMKLLRDKTEQVLDETDSSE